MLLHLPCPREYTFLHFNHSSSTLATIWVAIFCHNREASTLPFCKHLLKLQLLSTHPKVPLPDSPDISRRRAANSHPCVLCPFEILATCFGLASPKAALMSKLAKYIVGLAHCTMFHHGIPFFMPIPNVFVINSSPIPVHVGSLFRPFLQRVSDSSKFQFLFPSPNEEQCEKCATSTLLMAAQLPKCF